MSLEDYYDAQKKGLHELHSRKAAGMDPYLPVLADIVPEYTRMTQVSLGVVQIPMSRITGTVTKGRTTAFSASFLPLLGGDTEFASKWAQLYDGILEDGLRQPVTALEYYNQYYIVEGNKRVSVTRLMETPFIEAEVTRIIPEPEDSVRYRVYREFLSFYEDTKANFLLFTREGNYARLCSLVGRKQGEKWPEDAVFDLQSCCARFEQAYQTVFGKEVPMPADDALLVYLEIFGYTESVDKTPSEMGKEIERIRQEFVVAAANKPAVLISHPEEKTTLLHSVLHRSPSVVKIAFLYNSAPERSGWTYWHELGREGLERAFGSRVSIETHANVGPEEAVSVIEQCIANGASVIFACSPVLLEGCIRESALHPEVKILNCSLLASYHNVRSYYLRVYEAKFVLGMIAGSMAEDGRIGYIADYPIYGTPASINAFAMGAQLVNPRARIRLEWSTIPDHDPEASLAEKNITVISNRDISAPNLQSRSFGLYGVKDGERLSMAMPIWNWSRLYESIVRSVIAGAFNGEGANNADRAMNYYMGMSMDAIDIVYSERLPAGVQRMADFMHKQIRSGNFKPFEGPLYDQNGVLRIAKDQPVSRQEIIAMDYLAENVDGIIPKSGELNANGQQLVGLMGIKAATETAEA